MLVERAAAILPLSIVVVADKGHYDGQDNHIFVRERHKAYSIILLPRYHDVQVWRSHGKYRKQMKCGCYPKLLYNQRNRDWTI
jgi:hypothetical protein